MTCCVGARPRCEYQRRGMGRVKARHGLTFHCWERSTRTVVEGESVRFGSGRRRSARRGKQRTVDGSDFAGRLVRLMPVGGLLDPDRFVLEEGRHGFCRVEWWRVEKRTEGLARWTFGSAAGDVGDRRWRGARGARR